MHPKEQPARLCIKHAEKLENVATAMHSNLKAAIVPYVKVLVVVDPQRISGHSLIMLTLF